MSKLTNNYIAVTEGRMTKSEFLRQARQGFPGVVSQFNSYEDAINIFRKKGLLSEEVVYRCQGDRFPLETIERGIRYELEEMGYHSPCEVPCPGDYKKAKAKVIDNLCKDQMYYYNLISTANNNVELPKADVEDKMKEVKPNQKKVDLQESAYTEKRYGWSESDNVQTQLVQAILKKINPDTGKKYTPAEAKKKAAKMIKAKQAKKSEPKTEAVQDTRKKVSPDEQRLLKESITNVIQKVLSEAATANLAQLSDQHASVQGIPAILNSLENIVTEIESFILKTQTKIQSAFDSIGDIRNEDGIPVGYKFVEPILNSFKKDLEPVLQKVSLDNLKLPEAPEIEQEPVAGSEEPMEEPLEPKQTMFTPKSSLSENKQPRKRYTA